MKKFECLDCHQIFEADETKWIECPHCKSDNFKEASAMASVGKKSTSSDKKEEKKSDSGQTPENPQDAKKKYIGLAVFIAILATGFSVWHCSSSGDDTSADTLAVVEQSLDSLVARTDFDGTQEPVLSMVQEIPTFDGEGYSCDIKVEYPPQEPYDVVIVGAFTETVVAKSPDGKFTKIPCSPDEGGSYRVGLLSKDGSKKFCEYAPLMGFIKQVKVATKMQVAQIQALLNKKDPSLLGVGENDYLSPELKLVFTGLPADTKNVPENLAGVIEKIEMEDWKSATVTALQYDDMNRITQITIKVVDNHIVF